MIILWKYYAKDKVLFMFNLYPFKMSLMIGNLSHWCLVCIHSQLISSLPIILSSNPVNTCYKRKLIFPRSIRKLRNKQWVEFKISVVFKFDLIWIKFENQLWHYKRGFFNTEILIYLSKHLHYTLSFITFQNLWMLNKMFR